jgi:hypothetical protein
LIHEAGGSPAASYFLLLRQKKVTKEKATRVHRPAKSAGYPALLASEGGSGTRFANTACDEGKDRGAKLRQSSPKPPSLTPLLGDSHGALLLLRFSLRRRNWAPACAGAGGFRFCSFVSDFHFDPRCNFLSHAHPLQIILHFTTRRIREFPCCRANILEKGRGFPRKLLEVGAMPSPRATNLFRQTSCFRGPTVFRNVGDPEGVRDSGRLSLLTFFGEAKKVSCRRATPGSVAHKRDSLA